MNIYAATESRLTGDSAITALVGSARPRIYPGFASQDAALPYAAIMEIGGASYMSHQGSSGLASVTIQVTSWGTTYNAACTLDDKIRLRLQGFSGAAGSTPDYRCVRVTARRSVPEDSAGNEVQKRFGVSRDYTVMYRETQPT